MVISGPEAAARGDLPAIVRLVDGVFRSDYGHNTSMEDEFPVLFREENLSNLRVIRADGEPVATFCLYPSVLEIPGAAVPCAFVGSVATRKDFRGRGFAGMLFDDAEKLLVGRGIDLMLVSGDRSLYLRHGCTPVSPFGSFVRTVTARKTDSGLPAGWEKLTEDNLADAEELYGREKVKFLRPGTEFGMLFRGFSHEFSDKRIFSFLFRKDGRAEAYVVLGVRNGSGTVREFAGSRDHTARFFHTAERFAELDSVSLPVMPYETELAGILCRDGTLSEPKTYEHTLKVVHFPRLVKHLEPFFLRAFQDGGLSSLVFEEHKDGYAVGYEGETCVLRDIGSVNSLLFRHGAVETQIPRSLERLSGALSRVLPVPLPYLQNLNYI